MPGNNFPGTEPLQVLSVSVVSAPSTGAVTINPFDGSIRYTPETGFVGSDSFTYQVCHSSSSTPLCHTASVTIVVQPLAGAGIQYRLVTIDWSGHSQGRRIERSGSEREEGPHSGCTARYARGCGRQGRRRRYCARWRRCSFARQQEACSRKGREPGTWSFDKGFPLFIRFIVSISTKSQNSNFCRTKTSESALWLRRAGLRAVPLPTMPARREASLSRHSCQRRISTLALMRALIATST